MQNTLNYVILILDCLNDDYYNATDIILINNEKKLGICVLDASKNSKNMKKAKDMNRHETYNNMIKIENHTDIWNQNVETIGEIKVPNKKCIYEFANDILLYFDNNFLERKVV